MLTAATTYPEVLDDRIGFSLPADDAQVTQVWLECDSVIPGDRAFTRDGQHWRLELPRPALSRLEYRFSLQRGDAYESVLDAANPRRVDTAFGQRSVLELPGYAAPWWLTAPQIAGDHDSLMLAGETGGEVPVTLWAPTDLADREPAPLLLVHDGPEYDQLASLPAYSGALIAAGVLPPHRIALAHPVMRNAWYSGSPAYLRTIAQAGLGRIEERYAVASPVVVMGASLGGLTALLVGLLAPQIGGVFAQSGSFFQPYLDESEAGFPYFGRITTAVSNVLDAPHADRPLRVGMTCGVLEENAANNRMMASALRKAGHDVSHVEVADLHNYTAWRDSLDPTLTEVLRDLWA